MPLGGGIAAGIGSIGSGFMSGKGAKSASETQAAAADRANQMQYDMYNQQMSAIQPWQQAGMQALYGNGGLMVRNNGGSGLAMKNDDEKNKFIASKLAEGKAQRDAQISAISGPNADMMRQKVGNQLTDDVLQSQAEQMWLKDHPNGNGVDGGQYMIDPSLTRNFTADDFQKDPGYDFRMQEGQKALERSAAASGGLMSGNFAKELSKYGQDYASNEYGNAYNRFNNDQTNRFNRLSSIAGLGQNANSQISQVGQNYANQYGQNTMGAANAQGAAQIAQANAYGSTLSSLGQIPGQVNAATNLQNWMKANSDALNKK